MLDEASSLEIEDRLLGLSAALSLGASNASKPPPWLWTALEAIADLADDAHLKVHHLARFVGIHPVHLARVFMMHLGCSPGHTIRQTRVERVAASLTKERSVAGLAAEHGFADHANLTRCFRAAYGATPSQFRAAFD